ncbi:hypothetical protein [Streptomyces sp. NPDC055287]
MGFDRDRALGVVVLSNTDRPVDSIGQQLSASVPHRSTLTPPSFPLPSRAPRGPRFPHSPLRPESGPVRGRRFLDAGFAVTALALTRQIGDWLAVPPALWTAGLVLTTGALILDIVRPTAQTGPASTGPTGSRGLLYGPWQRGQGC